MIIKENANVPTCFAMVGLPARGKTFMSKKLSRYLNWIGVKTKVFNAGEYRRKLYGTVNCKHDFFDPSNISGHEARMRCVELALADVEDFLKNQDGQVAILDATNTTRERRVYVHNRCLDAGIKSFFIESICDDRDVIYQNIMEVKVSSPDYVGVDEREVYNDFISRIHHYEALYETLDLDLEGHLSFIKVINVGKKFLVNLISGYLQTRAVYFLMNIHIAPRSIYLTRHGESLLNLSGRIGGDSSLSNSGKEYSKKLRDFISSQNIRDLKVWTSTLKRTIETAELIDAVNKEQWPALDELDAGICDNMTYEEIQEKYPEDFARRDQDKYHYRYPRGESYEDVVSRLEPVIMELERQHNVLAVCHQAVMRCLLSYFLDTKANDIPYLNVPLHTVYKLTPVAYGCRVETFKLGVNCVDTYRKRPNDVRIDRSPIEALKTVPSHDVLEYDSSWNRKVSKPVVSIPIETLEL
ncbi:6-phosphofructo-2-kinase/fructose-2,6-bisphosphatase isoform X1 [Hydra vulgaris]|uniref:6-phosphofructo-2-kinase/fructose-2, 6-bisphosphatase isoform X1 n=1 Tax=Hydra vulgaris TaxID=6087 RepID=UPI001F5FE8A6|nr:6-phosphofructo-2-kinase/fructose-2,6-bisphosphatase-like isoform X1 [Hydra vulgaris]